jgi:XTP/dITP diphosphohydrolase
MRHEPNIIYFVTGNKNKFNEVFKIFQNENLNYELHQKDIDTVEIQANNIKDVALFKLKSVKEKIEGSFFIEDAGFFVDLPLNGFPGVYSSYVMKTIGNEGILKLIHDINDTKAHFSAFIALYFQPLNRIFTFEGEVKGKLSKTIRGEHGFGFDPIFIPDTLPNSTFAELSTNEKNKVSHRSIALNKLIDFLKENPIKK